MGCTSSVSLSERKIVLLGKTGDGKSSAGNTILGENVFTAKASASNGRVEYQKRERKVYGRKITGIDTPGAFDTDRNDEEIKSEIIKALIDCAPAVDAFIMVLKVGRYTEHENEAVQKLLNTFKDEHVLKHTVILFTFGEQLEGQSIEEFVKANSQLQELVDKCGGRCHVIDNKYWNKRKRGNKSNRVQVKNLMETIDKMVEENGRYSNELLQDVEKHIQEEVKNINEENVPPEEQREEAKKIVHCNYLRQFAGAATGALLGALFGIGVVVHSLLYILKEYLSLKAALAAVGVGAAAAEGAGAGAAAAGVGGAAAGSSVAAGVVGVAAVVGSVVGGVAGWKAAEKDESVYGAIAKVASDTLQSGILMIKGQK